MKNFFAAVAFILIAFSSIGQIPDMPLPELPEGEQIIYFDSLLQPVEKENACYLMYTWYHMGKDVWTMKSKWRNSKYHLVVSTEHKGKVGEPVPLNATFKWFAGQGRLVAQEEFRNGRFSGKTILYDKKGNQEMVYDYDKKWDASALSLYVEEFKNGKLKHAAFEAFDVERGRWKTLCTAGCKVSRDLQ